MITLHERNITSFPLDNGIGVLSDAIIAYAEEELNGMFEFYMEYDSEGHLVEELKEERIIKAKAQDKLGYQLFRIYNITKNHENDNLIVNAQHITYDLANNFVEQLHANDISKKQVMELISNSTVEPHPFNITSTNMVTRSSTKLYRTNPLQMIAGMEGSVLQIWGGQIERDNFNLIMHDRRGHDDGVIVSYEKNITGLTASFDISGLVTRIYPFILIEATDEEPERLITAIGKYIDSPHIDDYEEIYIEPIDYSGDDRILTENRTDEEIQLQLTDIASRYFNETGNDRPKSSMDVQFIHLWETEEYKDVAPLELVGMGDTVDIDHSRLNVNATAIVNYIKYDCIAMVNEEVKLGRVKSRFSDTLNKIDRIERKINRTDKRVNTAINSANGKNVTFYGPQRPLYPQKGDLWFQVVDGVYTRTYRFDGIEWQLIIDMDSQEAKKDAEDAKERADAAYNEVSAAKESADQAIDEAQSAFNKAQDAMSTSTVALQQSSEAITDAQDAFDKAQDALNVGTDAFDKAAESFDVSMDNARRINNVNYLFTGGGVNLVPQNPLLWHVVGDYTYVNFAIDELGKEYTFENFSDGYDIIVYQLVGPDIYSFYETIRPGGKFTVRITVDRNITARVNGAKPEDIGTKVKIKLTKGAYGFGYYSAEKGFQGALTHLAINQMGIQANMSDIDDNLTSITAISEGLSVRVSDAERNLTTLTQTASSLTSRVDDADNKFSLINQTIDSITQQVNDNEGNITTLQTTATALAGRITDAEGNLTTLTATAKGLQNRVSDVEGNVSTVTQLANVLERRMTDSEGNINSLQSTASSLTSRIGLIENWEIGGRNLVLDSDKGFKREDLSVTGNQQLIQITAYSFSSPVGGGKDYSIAIKAKGTGELRPYVSGTYRLGEFELTSEFKVFTNSRTTNSFASTNLHLYGVNVTELEIEWVKVVESNVKITDWSPAPEDIDHKFSSINQTIDSITTRVGDAEGNLTTLQQTSQSLANRITNAEGDISTVSQTAQGLQTRMTDAEGNITSVTQLATGLQQRVTNAEGDISSVTQLANALQVSVGKIEDGTASVITQLKDNINARVIKDDLINQINIDTSGVLISGKKLVLDGDTTVNGTFKLDGSAHIKDASIGTAQIGTIDAGIANIVNLNANHMTSGTISGYRSFYDLNNGVFSVNSQDGRRTTLRDGRLQLFRPTNTGPDSDGEIWFTSGATSVEGENVRLLLNKSDNRTYIVLLTRDIGDEVVTEMNLPLILNGVNVEDGNGHYLRIGKDNRVYKSLT